VTRRRRPLSGVRRVRARARYRGAWPLRDFRRRDASSVRGATVSLEARAAAVAE